MTASPSSPSGPNTPQGGGGDPSMEDILASIRRILSEDEAESPQGAAPAPHDVVPLDPSMLVEESESHIPPPPPSPPVPAPPPAVEAAAPQVPPSPSSSPSPAVPAPSPVPPSPAPVPEASTQSGLLAPEVAEKASSSVGSLLRTLASERQQVAVRAGGPTIEDLMREEIRPLLKAWLDANLPQLVERLVRAEIERVVGRALS